MGPDAESLSLADFILADNPTLNIDRYALAYSVMAWAAKQEQEQGK